MKIDRSQIRGSQFIFLIACFIQASSLLTSFVMNLTAHDSWFVILLAAIVCIPFLWVYRCLMVMYPNRNLLQILEELYGKVIGKTLGVLYTWFFITLTALNLIDFGEVVRLTIMVETPVMVLLAICIAVCAYAVRNGLRVVVHYSTLFSVIAISITLLSTLLLINQIDVSNYLPILQMPAKTYVQGTHIVSTIPLGELVVILMLMPNLKMSKQNVTKSLYWGFGLGILMLLIVVIRDVGVLGNTIKTFTLPSLITLQLINLGTALSRMEILFTVVLIMLLSYKISFLYYISVITVAQLTNSFHYKHFVVAIGALILIYGTTLYISPVSHMESAEKTVPIIWTLFEFIIPVLTLILAKLKMRNKKPEVAK